jgi:hypothetical protein
MNKSLQQFLACAKSQTPFRRSHCVVDPNLVYVEENRPGGKQTPGGVAWKDNNPSVQSGTDPILQRRCNGVATAVQ